LQEKIGLNVEERCSTGGHIEEGFLDCASRLLRRSEAEKQLRRLTALGMTPIRVVGAGFSFHGCEVAHGKWQRGARKSRAAGLVMTVFGDGVKYLHGWEESPGNFAKISIGWLRHLVIEAMRHLVDQGGGAFS
jgi:hypothetical protein